MWNFWIGLMPLLKWANIVLIWVWRRRLTRWSVRSIFDKNVPERVFYYTRNIVQTKFLFFEIFSCPFSGIILGIMTLYSFHMRERGRWLHYEDSTFGIHLALWTENSTFNLWNLPPKMNVFDELIFFLTSVPQNDYNAVSYTHLTLPTIYSV